MSRHYYAVYWPYGVNTFNFDHEPIGTVVPFDTAKARDAYVTADRFDGNFHKSVPDISPHSLRRTFCTLSRDAGVPDRDIMAAGGWNSPQMLDYYDMARRGLNGKAGDGLQDYLGKED